MCGVWESYVISLYDPATPSFVTGYVEYFATKDQLREFKEVLVEGELKDRLSEWLRLGGKLESLVGGEPLVTVVEDIFYVGDYKHPELSYTYENVWGYMYDLVWDKHVGKLIYFKTTDGQYKRAYSLSLEGLRLKSIESPGGYLPLTGVDCWGNGNLVTKDGDSLASIMSYVDMVFSSKEEMEADIREPGPIDLSFYFGDVFGDG